MLATPSRIADSDTAESPVGGGWGEAGGWAAKDLRDEAGSRGLVGVGGAGSRGEPVGDFELVEGP